MMMTPGKLYFTINAPISGYKGGLRPEESGRHSITIPKHSPVMFVRFLSAEDIASTPENEWGWYRERWSVILYEEKLWLIATERLQEYRGL